MRPTEYRNIISEEIGFGVHSLRNIDRALAKLKIVGGWDELTPLKAAWQLYAAVAIQNASFHEALLFLEDRRDEWEQFNKEEDTPVWALAVLMSLPDSFDAIPFILFTEDGRMIVNHGKYVKIFPKKLSAFDKNNPNKTIDTKEFRPFGRATIVSGATLKRIALRLGLIAPGATAKKAVQKVLA